MLRGRQSGSVSVPIVKIAVAGIALGICVMLLSVFVITGFKQEITAKLSGFMAHLNIAAYENKVAYADRPVSATGELLDVLREIQGVKQVYA
ncbi:MAG: ABC transporter permease, partial [Odoribacter sp.]|nr:ABC transporter permease [Odoribacter sp.]